MTNLLPAKDVELVRSLGKAAYVLILLLMLNRPVGESDIAGILNLYPTTVRKYLQSLAHLGVATRISRYQGWILTCEGRQMILGTSWINHNGSKDASEEEIEKVKGVEGKIKTSVKNSRSNGKKSRSSMKISRSLTGRGYQLKKKENSAGPSTSQLDSFVQANLEAFASIGLARNDLIYEICEMDYVTPDYILGQKKRLQAERRYSPGLLLTVIRSKDYLADKYLSHEG